MFEKRGLNPNWRNNFVDPKDAAGIMPVIVAADKNHENAINSFRDNLTDCRNRRYFDEVKNEFEKDFDPNSSHGRIAFVYADLNNLKIINDSMGHDQGDVFLVNAAKFLKTNFRKSDHVYRIGGDEFVIVCKNTQNDSDFEKHLIKKINSDKFRNAPVSMAFGVAIFDKTIDENFNDTLKRADQRMYEQKAKMKKDQTINSSAVHKK